MSELARIREGAIAAAKRAYPETAQEQAAYWDELLTCFIRAHGAELAADAFGIELSTARALLYVSMFPPHATCSIFARAGRVRSAGRRLVERGVSCERARLDRCCA